MMKLAMSRGLHLVAALATMLTLSLAANPANAQTGVRATVNGQQITDNQVTQRARLFQVEGNRGGASAALDQLIEEALKMQEAERLNISVAETEIDAAYLQVARNVQISKQRLDEILRGVGATPETLRDRLEAAIAWNEVVQGTIAPQVQVSDLALDQQAENQLNATMSFDYILKEVIFLAPGGQNASARTAQANRYRGSFSGCDSAVDLTMNYTDAAVIDVGRRHATQLPEAVARELAGLNVGGITSPRVTDRGVSMLAVCEKAQANDTTFIKEELRSEAGQDQVEADAAAFLEELREKARIVRN
ncbi:hypothetical protein GCM10007989_34090 [Devosia pacifica]|uniref:Periplasmic chaperone for outer membrane proteins SurA n=1 Tax=Devosia pacifica TaxID=1335967 RepID=A0A918SEY0_9HYPH|nr:SurA N-terminal domain-containing protein [Devosia pacifica]GHA35339.1 hypothetical protein GCM10007989_34090 [Devosia pacifica]